MFKYVRLFRILLLSSLILGLSSCAGQQEIVSGLSENDANQVIVVLQSQDISATKVSVAGRVVTFAISVSSSDAKKALKLLVDNKLPKRASPGLAQVYPLGGGGLIPSATQEKAQLMMALQGEIENMLLVLPGIVQARVVIVLPDTSVIRDSETPPPQSTASVAVVYNPADEKGNPSVSSDDIRFLIASAIPDLSPNGVTVVMASNYPMKLIDAKKGKAKSVLSSATASTVSAGPTQVVTPTIDAPIKAAVATPTSDAEKSEFLLMLFGGLAGLGLLFGILGLARAMILKTKLTRMEKSMRARAHVEGTSGE